MVRRVITITIIVVWWKLGTSNPSRTFNGGCCCWMAKVLDDVVTFVINRFWWLDSTVRNLIEIIQLQGTSRDPTRSHHHSASRNYPQLAFSPTINSISFRFERPRDAPMMGDGNISVRRAVKICSPDIRKFPLLGVWDRQMVLKSEAVTRHE